MAGRDLPSPSADDKSPPGVEFDEFWDPEDLARRHGPNGPVHEAQGWGAPDMGVLRLHRRPPPVFPIEIFGDKWGEWITEAAKAASTPPDYVMLPLLSTVSTLIGNARWAQASAKWVEPPHLWTAACGDSGDGKSPGTDCLFRDVLPELEHRMTGDFPERHHEWLAAVAADAAAKKNWEQEQRAALKEGKSFTKPMPTPTVSDVEPERPRLRQNDVTIEQVAAILASAAPKGVMIVRDELVGWLDGMNAYHPAGRAFWNESYGGRPYRVERRKHSGHPIDIPRLAVAVCGGTQPDRLVKLLEGADDGLLARIQWGWPDPIPFKLGHEAPGVAWAIEALDRLRELNLAPGDPPAPILTPLTPEGQRLIEKFGQEMQERRTDTGGLLRSAFGKARGTALRISLNLELLWWCGQDGFPLPPDHITPRALAAAAMLVSDYFMPSAGRVFGDAGASETERNAATLARWIVKEHPPEVHVRHLQREVRLPGLRTAEQIKKAADTLIETDWLRAPAKTVFGQPRSKVTYPVNPKVYEA
jgi:hypothetical protein